MSSKLVIGGFFQPLTVTYEWFCSFLVACATRIRTKRRIFLLELCHVRTSWSLVAAVVLDSSIPIGPQSTHIECIYDIYIYVYIHYVENMIYLSYNIMVCRFTGIIHCFTHLQLRLKAGFARIVSLSRDTRGSISEQKVSSHFTCHPFLFRPRCLPKVLNRSYGRRFSWERM